MKTIGFIDYYLSEWHANNYPDWIRRANEALGLDLAVRYAWAEKDVSDVDGVTTDAWCAAHSIERCRTIEELCEKSDYILILAPSNPEKHLPYAEAALPYGKRTYIDKTFAPDAATAQRIFSLGAAHGASLFSSSALRFGDELTPYAGLCDTATVLGGGASVEEYVIHQVEMLVKLMGCGAAAVRAERAQDQFNISIRYNDGRTASILFLETYDLPMGIIPHTPDHPSAYIPVISDYFGNLISAILHFFTDGRLPFDTAETMEVMRIREAIVTAKYKNGAWINV